MAKRRPRSDSIASALRAMENAGEPPLEPPAHCALRVGDRPFWEGLMASRSRDSWTEADLVLAVQLARCQADIEAGHRALDALSGGGQGAEATVGGEVIDADAMDQLVRREMALMRMLRLGGVIAGTPRDEAGARSVERQARKLRTELKAETGEESLLAT
jgi:hypothetical protein